MAIITPTNDIGATDMKNIVLAVLLVAAVNTGRGEDTALHGVQGFALHYAIAKGFGASKTVCTAVGFTGALFGALPDVPYRNKRFHDITGELGIINAIPAFALHIGIDIPWHSGKFGNRWDKDWRFVALDFVIWAATLWIVKELIEFNP